MALVPCSMKPQQRQADARELWDGCVQHMFLLQTLHTCVALSAGPEVTGALAVCWPCRLHVTTLLQARETIAQQKAKAEEATAAAQRSTADKPRLSEAEAHSSGSSHARAPIS